MNKNNICIIDDDKIFQFTMKLSFKSIENTNEINFFNDGLEAIDFIASNYKNLTKLPDVIFLDINMPVMDGYQFIEEYKKIKSKIKKDIIIYMLSSSVDPVDLDKVKHIDEVSNYIIKPLKKNVLNKLFNN